jgi:hypothetical protein
MRLSFVGITPDTPNDGCPAVYVDEDTGDIWIQGPAVTDSGALAEVARHSPISAGEAVVKVAPIMRSLSSRKNLHPALEECQWLLRGGCLTTAWQRGRLPALGPR